MLFDSTSKGQFIRVLKAMKKCYLIEFQFEIKTRFDHVVKACDQCGPYQKFVTEIVACNKSVLKKRRNLSFQSKQGKRKMDFLFKSGFACKIKINPFEKRHARGKCCSIPFQNNRRLRNRIRNLFKFLISLQEIKFILFSL